MEDIEAIQLQFPQPQVGEIWKGRENGKQNLFSTPPAGDRELGVNPSVWSEIDEDGTVYNITLKKLRYHSLFTEKSKDGDISFMQWETIKVKQLKAGTLEKLIEYLTPAMLEANEFDSGFLLAFLCTYKGFATTEAVVKLILKRFELCENNLSSSTDQDFLGIMKRICSVLTFWFDKYPNDFDEPPSYPSISSIISFTDKRMHLSGMKELQSHGRGILNKLSVSPFDYDMPFKFKFCSCSTIVGCTCETSISSATYEVYQSLNIGKFSADCIAEQLTLADSELFLRVSPRECLGSSWSKRDRSKGSLTQSIKLTIDQFNAVSRKVISTILSARIEATNHLCSAARSKVIEKWIDVALELRELKNFSSLKAILSSLQSSAIYRLSRTWELIPKQCKGIYEELAKIFSSDLNQKASRDILVQEGTAKYSTHSLKKSNSKRDTWKREGITQGTVPYLGTFLTDLMMIDTAHPDFFNDDLINFEKRRKEFEIIVQIKLLQEAAKNYHIKPYKDFFVWFNSIPEYSDKEGYNKSVEVEPTHTKAGPVPSTPQPNRRKKGNIKRCKSESDILHPFTKKEPTNSSLSPWDSCNSLANNLNSLAFNDDKRIESLSNRTSLNPSDLQTDDNFLIVRVFLEDSIGALYKCVQIFSNTRACDLISVSLRKFNSSEEPTKFSLYQILDNKKSLHIPMNSNLFYAMNKCKELCFKVCKKKLPKKYRKKNRNAFSSPLDTENPGILCSSYSPL